MVYRDCRAGPNPKQTRKYEDICMYSAARSDLSSPGHRQLRQQVFYVDQMVVEYLLGNVQQVEQLRVPNGVVHVLTVFSGGENVAGPENGQLLGQVALLNIEARAEVIYPDLTFPEFVQYSDPQRVGKGLEELGLKLTDFTHLWLVLTQSPSPIN